MKLLLAPVAAFGLALAFPVLAQDAPPPPATDSAAPASAPMAPPAPTAPTDNAAPAPAPSAPADSAAPPPAPAAPIDNAAPPPATATSTAADTAKPDPAPANPPVCGPGVTDRCVQSAADQRLAAKEYSDRLPHNDNAALHGGGKKPATKRHRR